MSDLRSAKGMEQIVSQARHETVLFSRVPTAADLNIQIGDEVLCYREGPIGKGIGLFFYWYASSATANRLRKLEHNRFC